MYTRRGCIPGRLSLCVGCSVLSRWALGFKANYGSGAVGCLVDDRPHNTAEFQNAVAGCPRGVGPDSVTYPSLVSCISFLHSFSTTSLYDPS